MPYPAQVKGLMLGEMQYTELFQYLRYTKEMVALYINTVHSCTLKNSSVLAVLLSLIPNVSEGDISKGAFSPQYNFSIESLVFREQSKHCP